MVLVLIQQLGDLALDLYSFRCSYPGMDWKVPQFQLYHISRGGQGIQMMLKLLTLAYSGA